MLTYEQWESISHTIPETEVFKPILGEVIGYQVDYEKKTVVEIRKVLGYSGKATGTVLGPWFADIMEPF